MPSENPTQLEPVSAVDLVICDTEETLRMPPLRQEGLIWYEQQLRALRAPKVPSELARLLDGC